MRRRVRSAGDSINRLVRTEQRNLGELGAQLPDRPARPIYYFGVYAYAPGVIRLGDFYPGQVAAFVSCDSPPEEDQIAAFGTFGCGGAQGEQACFEDELGACCIGPDCFILTEGECLAVEGDFYGGPCDPSPCPPAEGACCIDTNGDGNDETCIVTDEADCSAQGGTHLGDGSDCDPPPCPPNPPIATQKNTWGQIKSVYR